MAKEYITFNNITLEEKVNLLIEDQENITKIKPKDLKEFIQELEVAEFVDQQHYCNLIVENLEENALKHKNSEKIFASETIKNVLRSLV